MKETCQTCGELLYNDQTNHGVVTRCRNPQCPVGEVTE